MLKHRRNGCVNKYRSIANKESNFQSFYAAVDVLHQQQMYLLVKNIERQKI